ncbi:MAG TPA: helix-turn-helix transcriptional regulator [Micromonosporaceae bacterium]
MARRPTPDPTIGDRVRARRQIRGWSIRHAADRAGLAHTTWSRIERGLVSADNRFTVADIAAALECSVADLTGQPAASPDNATAAAQATIAGIRQALVEADLTEDPVTTARPLPELARETELVADLLRRCDYAGIGRMLPRLIRELHAATHGPDRRDALRLQVLVAVAASGVMRYVVGPAESWLAAERCWQAAQTLEDPVCMGLGLYERAHAATGCGSYSRGVTLARRGVDVLDGHTDAPGALEMLGQLYLTITFAAIGDHGDAGDLVAEVERIAERTGDTDTLGLMFGPTNTRFWRIAMETDGGEPGRAVEIAAGTNPTLVDSPSRQVAFYTDTARALARVRRDRDAIRFLLQAERMAPVRVHSSPLIRETVRGLLDRAQRRAGGVELRALCERMNIA